jgi:glucose 1-dehydrogenase
VAIVTGASSGIGRAIAIELGSRGYGVCVNFHRGGEAAAGVAREITQAGGSAFACAADVSSRQEVTAMVEETVGRLGRLDLLVNNAGVERPMPFLELTEGTWDLTIAIDLKGVFLCAQAAARQMAQQNGGGVIINISSVHEDLPFPSYAPYVAAKGGVRMLTRDLALELAPHRIRVVGIGPGAIATPINKATLDDPERRAALMREIPLGRIGTAEEVARLVAYVASSDADYITGTTLFIDGGLMRQTGGL